MKRSDLIFSIIGMIIVGSALIMRGVTLDNTEPEQKIFESFREMPKPEIDSVEVKKYKFRSPRMPWEDHKAKEL